LSPGAAIIGSTRVIVGTFCFALALRFARGAGVRFAGRQPREQRQREQQRDDGQNGPWKSGDLDA
jgi:hypothetical protein